MNESTASCPVQPRKPPQRGQKHPAPLPARSVAWEKVCLMPFGKFKGKPVADVSTSYLRWALAECEMGSGLTRAIREELERRGERYVSAPEVFADLEECLTVGVSSDPDLDHATAGVLCDHVLDTFQVIREKYGITQVTELVIAGRPVAGNWRKDDDPDHG